jgi:tetratricopeptide (TPR) repeat protein
MKGGYMRGFCGRMVLILLVIQMASCGMIYRHMKQKMKENYREGISLYRKGKYAEAMDRFQEVISIDPEHRGAKRYISITKEAMEKTSRVHYRAAMRYKRSGNYDKALDELLIVMKKDSDYRDTTTQIDAIRSSDRIQKAFERTMKSANRLYDRKRYTTAYRTSLKAEKYNPESLELMMLKMKIEGALNDKSSPYRNKGEDLYSRGKYRSAQGQLKKALRVNPWDKDARELLGKCNKKIQIAELYARAKREYSNKDYFAAYGLFQKIDRMEPGYRDARAYIERTKNKLSGSINVYYKRGIAYYNNEQFKEAIGELNKVLKINPGHKQAREYKDRARAKLSIMRSLED